MITRKNYYEILGVTPDSEIIEIKAVYRKLARKYHPDVNPKSADIFKDITEAYDTLCHDEKRKQYDILNGYFKTQKTKTNPKQAEEVYKNGFEAKKEAPEQPKKQQYSSNSQNFKETKKEFKQEKPSQSPQEKDFSKKINDALDEFLKSSIEKNAKKKQEKLVPKKGSDIETEISISISESVQGTTRTVNVMHTQQCPTCKGRKFINEAMCKVCKGVGEYSKHKKITVTIPANIKNGAKLRLKEEGNEGQNGGKNGDIYLKITIEQSSKIKYDGVNILYNVPLTPYEAVLGGDILVPTFEGNVTVKIPAQTNSGQKFRLSGQGLKQGGKIGDMIVTVHIEIPCSLSDDEIELYRKLKKMSTHNLRENLLNE